MSLAAPSYNPLATPLSTSGAHVSFPYPMNPFFTRTETDRDIVITYKPYFTYLFLLAIPVWAWAGTQPEESVARGVAGLLWMAVLVVLLWRAFVMRKVWSETRQAMRRGGVTLKGTKLNPRNPFTITIAR